MKKPLGVAAPKGQVPKGKVLNNTNGTAPAPEGATPDLEEAWQAANADALLEDPYEYEEDEDYTLRQALGLRPVFLSDKQAHLDQRPCPPWCWVVGTDHKHEVDPRTPNTAQHSHDTISMPLSCYHGRLSDYPGANGVIPATLEVHLRQEGQGTPHITVWRRGYPNGGEQVRDKLLKLSMNDVRDLRAILEYVLNIVDQDPAEVAMTR